MDNDGTFAVTVGTGKSVRADQGNGIFVFSGYSSGIAQVDLDGSITAGLAGIEGRGTRNDFIVNVAETGSIVGMTGVELITATDFTPPSRFAGDQPINWTPHIPGLTLGGALTVNNAGTISGTETGVRLSATGSGTALLSNSGQISGGINAVSGGTAGTAFALTNSGTLTGLVNVAGSSIAQSLFANTGTWNVGSGNSAFSGWLTNAGMINALNGVAGDTHIVVSGNYVGGGQLALDANTATGQADTLSIAGTATGTTAVTVNRLGQGRLPGGFLPLVTVTGGASAGTFTSTSFASAGVFLESFRQNPANSTQFGIYQAFNPLLTGLGGLQISAATVSAGRERMAASLDPIGGHTR